MLLALGALLTLTAALYALACWVSPFARCRWCRGFGERIRTDRHGRPKAGRPCRHCRGTGRRLRYGHRARNLARRLLADDTND